MKVNMLNIDTILSIRTDAEFEACALELFRYQSEHCEPYRRYIELLDIDPNEVRSIEEIPFMPIRLFKSTDVYCGTEAPEIVFTSSNTGSTVASRHMMASLEAYRKTFTAAFK